MKLVFRLCGIGFALPVADLLEIREGVGGWLDKSVADPEKLILGTLPYRGEMIPIRDLKRRFQLAGRPGGPEQTVLVVAGKENVWGGLVEKVEGIFPQAAFEVLTLPWLVTGRTSMPFDRILVMGNEPLVLFDLSKLEARWGFND